MADHSTTGRVCYQTVRKGHTPGHPNTIPPARSLLWALCMHVPHTACTNTDVAKTRRQQRTLCARVPPCLRAPCPYLRCPFCAPNNCLIVPCLCRVRSVCTRLPHHYFGDPLTNPLRVSYSAHSTCYVHHAYCFWWLLLLYVRKYSHYTSSLSLSLSSAQTSLSAPLPGLRTRKGVLPFTLAMCIST